MNLLYETDAEDDTYNSLHCLEWKWMLLLKLQVIHTTHITHGPKPQARKGVSQHTAVTTKLSPGPPTKEMDDKNYTTRPHSHAELICLQLHIYLQRS